MLRAFVVFIVLFFVHSVSYSDQASCIMAANQAYTVETVLADGRIQRNYTDQAAWRAAMQKCRDDATAAAHANRTATNAPTNNGGSVTRVTSGCAETNIPGKGTLKVCSLTPGGTAGNTTVMFLDGVEYNGRVRKKEDGTYELIPVETLTEAPVRTGQTLPGEFSCGQPSYSRESSAADEDRKQMQCLVCSCFFEARGVSFPEQVRIARTKHSRVINHRFPGTICENVYYKTPRTANGGGGAAAYSWTTDNNTYESKNGPMSPRDVTLGETSPHMLDQDKASYRSCVQASAESMHYRNEYFASYYYTRNLDTRGGWIAQCKRNTTHLSAQENTVTGALNSEGNPVEFAHLFRRVCEANELSYLPSPFAPTSSPRPVARPPRASGAVD